MHQKDDKENSVFVAVMKEPLGRYQADISRQLSLASQEKGNSFFRKMHRVADIFSVNNRESPAMQLAKDVINLIVENYIALALLNDFKLRDQPPTAYSSAHLRNKSGGCKIRHK